MRWLRWLMTRLSVGAQADDIRQGMRAPMAVGERLYANPCDVVVTSRPESGEGLHPPGGVWARAHCRTCDDEHILDAGLFDKGRGPWRRVLTLIEDEDGDEESAGFLAAFVECTECKAAVLTMVHTAEDGVPYVDPVTCNDH